jgi:hypothetical protein
MHNIFNKITIGNFPNLEKELPIQILEAISPSNRLDQNEFLWYIFLNNKHREQRKNIEGCKRKKITYKGKSIKIIADFSTKTLKGRRGWSEVL